jgi:hypothetical protein
VLILLTYQKINEIAIIPTDLDKNTVFGHPGDKNKKTYFDFSCLASGQTFVKISGLSVYF